MFRWPIELTPLSLGSNGVPQEAMLEVTPRGAVFTLAALSHVGHPAHLALIDAYLKGQVRRTPTTSVGEDCRLVASSLAAPLLAAHELGVERLSLADLCLLPREEGTPQHADRSADGHPTFTADSPRFLLRAGTAWHWLRGAERFETAGCQGTGQVGLADRWHHVVVQLPGRADFEAAMHHGPGLAPIAGEVRAPSAVTGVTAPETVSELRAQALARFERLASRERRPDLDGYQTRCLLPPADADPSCRFETMRDLAWGTIEGLIGRPLPERRTEPIALRLVARDGRTTTLDVGASVVIGRNQVVFAAWVGSDGRVMLKLLPPGGVLGR